MTSIATAIFSNGATLKATIRRCLAGPRQWIRARRDYRLLCQMDDSALKDIGLRSSDLRDATAVGMFGDPTLLIAGRADERNRRRR